MANYDQRTPLDYRFGQLSGGVDSLSTTLTSPDFASFPSDLSAVKYVPLVLADDSAKLYEVVWVTGHSAASQTVTVVRGREGSAARAWGTGALWRCAPTTRDVQSFYATRAALPADAHLGMRAFIADEARALEKTSLGWKAGEPPFGHLGAVDAFQTLSPANGAYILFSAAQDLSGGMAFDNANDALTIPIAGRYQITVHMLVSGGSATFYKADAVINSAALPVPAAALAGAAINWFKSDTNDYTGFGQVTRRLAANDKLRLWGSGPNSSWGSNGYNGTWLEALYVGP